MNVLFKRLTFLFEFNRILLLNKVNEISRWIKFVSLEMKIFDVLVSAVIMNHLEMMKREYSEAATGVL